MEKGHMACLRGDSYQADEHGVDLLTATEVVVTTAPDLLAGACGARTTGFWRLSQIDGG